MKRVMAVITVLSLFVMLMTGFTFTAQAAETEEPAIPIGETTVKLPAISDSVLYNGDFEILDAKGNIDGWTARSYNVQGETGIVGATVVTGAEAYQGNSVKLRGSEKCSYPFVQKGFKVEGKATYQISLWVKKEMGKSAATAKLEFYATAPTAPNGYVCVQDGNTFSRTTTNGWENVLYNFVAPFTAESVMIMPRIHSSDESEWAYFDNVECYMVAPPAMMEIQTDAIFYYPEQETGKAEANVLINSYPEAVGGSVDFSILDGTKVLASGSGALSEEGKTTFTFSTSLLSELKKEYSIQGILKDKNGKVLFTSIEPIYKFNRPNYMGKDGVFRANGEVFYPVITYHVSQRMYPKCTEAGITVVQGSVGDLEEAAKYGMKVLVTLYGNMQPAGHPVNAEYTRQVVSQYKDDPRVFGWAVMDEPFLNMANPLPELRESYRLIRSIDDNHPVYICEASKGYFKYTSKCVDVLCSDPYLPQSGTPKMNTTHVIDYIRAARQSTDGLKPVVSLNQAFKWYDYLPDGKAERHMTYQSLMAGAAGHGYYVMAGANTENGVKVPLYEVTETDLWNGITSFAKNEQADVYKHFAEKVYPGFLNSFTADALVRGYVKNDKLYLIVMNQSISVNKTVQIPLVSFDGKTVINGFTAKTIVGNNAPAKVSNSEVSITLTPYETAILEITPTTPDFERISAAITQKAFWAAVDTANGITPETYTVHYTDLDNHGFASDAIYALRNKGVFEEGNTFRPGEAIKRGEMALYLMRTLGLTGTSTESFSDVSADAPYAEAVAAGKAKGIFVAKTGTQFKPDDILSRGEFTELILRAVLAQKGVSLPERALTEAEIAENDLGILCSEEFRTVLLKEGGSAFSVNRAEAACMLIYLTTLAEKNFDAGVDISHYDILMDAETRILYLRALLTADSDMNGKTQFATYTDGGRTFGLYVNKTGEAIDKVIAKTAKSASLLVMPKDAEATYDGSSFVMNIPKGSFIFVEFSAGQPAGIYINKLRQCYLPETGYFRGDDLVLAGAYEKVNGTLQLIQLSMVNGKFQVPGSGEYVIKCFRWSDFCKTEKEAIVVKQK